MTNKLRAEVISIGDEMTSGQRLDTNTQWLSQQLGELGVEVAFHTTVGDEIQDNVDIFDIATQRADIVICTGGLGPTADDLTREAIARMAKVELEFHPHVIEHIQKIYSRHSREMPERNKAQAYFPQGSKIIDNPEGTAPGIDFEIQKPSRRSRIFALPGVPYEMKQMWEDSVEPAIREITGQTGVILHHVIHCFGTGESQTEAMLPDLIQRGRKPRVGITASFATISLRVTAQAETMAACVEQMEPTLKQIRETMGDFVFGEENIELHEVVAKLLAHRNQRVAIADTFLKGDVAKLLLESGEAIGQPVLSGSVLISPSDTAWLGNKPFQIEQAALKIKQDWQADIGLAIGPLVPNDASEQLGEYAICMASKDGIRHFPLNYGGHSQLRHIRSVKQVLNQLRLLLMK